MARRWFGPALAVLAVIASGILHSRIPDSVRLAWAPDRPSSRLMAAFALPATIAALSLGARLLPLIDPRRANYARFEDTFWRLVNAGCAFLAVLHAFTLGSALGLPLAGSQQMILAAAGVTVAVAGNYLTRVQPNWFVGIRTPWTLSSDTVWRKTHRLAGRLMVLAGLVLVGLSFAPPRAVMPVVAASIAITAGTSLAYSFILWRREQLAGPPQESHRSA